LTIVPILCFDEFHFSMPGVNEYLNDQFQENMNPNLLNKFTVKPVTLISLNNLFDLVLRKKNFDTLHTLIDRYWHIQKERKKKFERNPTQDGFLRAHSSFDEIYQTIFEQEFDYIDKENHQMTKLLGLAGIDQKDLDRVI
jgi:hypothetical protein